MTPVGGGRSGAPAVGLVGRRAELAALRAHWEEARCARPRFVLCSGEAGIGKSRLAEEIAAEVQRSGSAVRWARASADPPPPPYWLWRQLLSENGRQDGPDSAGGHDPTRPVRFDPATDQLVFFDSVTRTLVAEASDEGMLVVLDDVQWADPSSLHLLVHLVRHLRGARLLVLATERTPPASDGAWSAIAAQLAQDPMTDRLVLTGLDPTATAQLLEASGGRVAADGAGAAYSLTGGNPFFVKELGRAGYDTARAAPPKSVLQIVGYRMKGLSTQTQQLLRVAAVLGDRFSLSVAAALADRPVMACLSAVDEAIVAGYLTEGDAPGEWRFSHGLVRSALEASLSLTERVTLHRRAAEAVEATYGGRLAGRCGDLARHWGVAAVTGEWEPAVRWSVRAAEEAVASQAFEDAAAWYQNALQVGGENLDMETRAGILTGLARARWKCGDLDAARSAVTEVVGLGLRAGQPAIAAEALLVLEAIGDELWDRDLVERGGEILELLGDECPGLRARLLARRSEAALYARDYDEADAMTAEALAVASASGDAGAEVAALRARQLVRASPEHHDERVELSRRMIAAGQTLRDPATELWGRLWKIDAHWEQAELSGVAMELGRVDWCADRVGGPVARWHALVPRAALAQATARFDEALSLGAQAFALMSPIQPYSAFGAYRSLVSIVAHHVGAEHVPALAGDLLPPPPSEGRSGRASIYQLLGPAFDLVELGRMDAAADFYLRLGPPSQWDPEPYFMLPAYACGAMVAEALERADHLQEIATLLERHRGRQVVVPAGAGSFVGPVELHLGRISAALGRAEAAVADLTEAATECRRSGALGWAVEAECLIAEVLAKSPDAAERRRGSELADDVGRAARRLGMKPWAKRAGVAAAEGGSGPGQGLVSGEALSRRELEVAGLVAEGLTNRQIADRLYLSERTAQNHVQHILVKLGFSNRSQIASWAATRRQGMSIPAE